jgi:hypothetical protein
MKERERERKNEKVRERKEKAEMQKYYLISIIECIVHESCDERSFADCRID